MSDPGQPAPARPGKSAAAFRTIGEVADELELPTHVLRFWETKFPQLKPVKRSGGRRYYRPDDIRLLRLIRQWLHQDGYTIRGAQQLLESLPSDFAATGEASDIAGPLAAAHDANAAADPGSDIAPESAAASISRPQAPAGPGPDRRAAYLDPETRAEFEKIRRDLQQARALLDGLLRPSKSS